MSSFNEIRLQIETKFQDEFLTHPIQFGAVAFDAPDDLSPWVRLSITYDPSLQVAMGDVKRYRHTGFVSVQVFTEKNKGTAKGLEIADEVSAIFRSKIFNGIVTKTPSVIGPSSEENSWQQVLVSIPFYYDELSAD